MFRILYSLDAARNAAKEPAEEEEQTKNEQYQNPQPDSRSVGVLDFGVSFVATEVTRHMNRIVLVSIFGFERMFAVLVMVLRLFCVDDHDRWLLLHRHWLLLVLHWLAVCV